MTIKVSDVVATTNIDCVKVESGAKLKRVIGHTRDQFYHFPFQRILCGMLGPRSFFTSRQRDPALYTTARKDFGGWTKALKARGGFDGARAPGQWRADTAASNAVHGLPLQFCSLNECKTISA
ncbi:MAG: hypothetical protein WCN95_08595 [bacterium]